MRWRKLGLVWCPDGSRPWARSHAMCPTPVRLSDNVIRVYVTCLDGEGRGHAAYVDVSAEDPLRIVGVSPSPVLNPGIPGAFDCDGIMPVSIWHNERYQYMYFAGFELCKQIRYRIFSGLAISEDGGETFVRYSGAPILDRVDGELFFRGGPFVLEHNGRFRLWYVGGDSWTMLDGKPMPIYDLRCIESDDGKQWLGKGLVSMEITEEDEHGFGRPWVVRRVDGTYQLYYSIRRRSLSNYRLGYAESVDGIHWTRKDHEMGLDVTAGSFDSDGIMYSAVVSVRDTTWCFYNGNEFGKNGFAVAELVG